MRLCGNAIFLLFLASYTAIGTTLVVAIIHYTHDVALFLITYVLVLTVHIPITWKFIFPRMEND